jgi:spoIIIJ-associated protein
MSTERTNLEIIAPSVEEAIEKGLSDLGLPEEAVEIEILDAGTRGFLGLGTRQARVRLIVKGTGAGNEPVHRTQASSADKGSGFPLEPSEDEEDMAELLAKSDSFRQDEDRSVEEEHPSDEDQALRVARETVSELIEKMKVQARVTSRYGEALDADGEKTIQVDIHGKDLSILIGRKSETLNALQYIAGQIVGKELERWVSLQLDVEGYRARRERALRQLAHRMAEQAVITGRRQVLEPMPANERRLVHLELRDHPDVITESTGDEPNRKVTIVLKK